MSIYDYSETPGLNTNVGGVSVAEGCPPSNINNAIRQMMADLADFIAGGVQVWLGLAAGSADVMTFTAPSAPEEYRDGDLYRWRNTGINTGAVTIQVNALDAEPLLDPNGDALAAGALKANEVYQATYYNGAFYLSLSQADLNEAVAAAEAAQAAAEAALAAVLLSGSIYPDVTTGRADVTLGGYFAVIAASPADDIAFSWYREETTSATLLTAFPSAASMQLARDKARNTARAMGAKPIFWDFDDVLGAGARTLFLPREFLARRGSQFVNDTGIGVESDYLPDYTELQVPSGNVVYFVYYDSADSSYKTASQATLPADGDNIWQLGTAYGQTFYPSDGTVAYPLQGTTGGQVRLYRPLIVEAGGRIKWPRMVLDNGLFAYNTGTDAYTVIEDFGQGSPAEVLCFSPALGEASQTAVFVSSNPNFLESPVAKTLLSGFNGLITPMAGIPTVGCVPGGYEQNEMPSGKNDIANAVIFNSAVNLVEDVTDVTALGMGFTSQLRSSSTTSRRPYYGCNFTYPVAPGGPIFFRVYVASDQDDSWPTMRVYYFTDAGNVVATDVPALEERFSARFASFIFFGTAPEDTVVTGGWIGIEGGASRDCAIMGVQAAGDAFYVRDTDYLVLGEAGPVDVPGLVANAPSAPDILMPDDLYVIQGRGLPFYPEQVFEQQSEGLGVSLVLEALIETDADKPIAQGGRDARWIDGSFAGEARLVARTAAGSQAIVKTLPVGIHAAPPASLEDTAFNALAIGDSLLRTYGVLWAADAKLTEKGAAVTWGGTILANETSLDDGDPTHTTPTEARNNRSAADFTYAATDLPPVVSVANYLSLSASARVNYNPFIRPATGSDNPAHVCNGYIFDLGYWISNYSQPAPKYVILGLGTNDMDDGDDPADEDSVYDNNKILIERIWFYDPTITIFLALENIGWSDRGRDRWEFEQTRLLRAKLQLYREKASPYLRALPYHAFTNRHGGWGYPPDGAADAVTGQVTSTMTTSGMIHPQRNGANQIAEVLLAAFACAEAGAAADVSPEPFDNAAIGNRLSAVEDDLANLAVAGVTFSADDPEPVGEADPGDSNAVARADHVHAVDYADVGGLDGQLEIRPPLRLQGSTFEITEDHEMSRRDDPANVIYGIMVFDQSKFLGTGSGGTLHGIGNEVDPLNILMPQYADEDGVPVTDAGPLQFGFPQIVAANTVTGLVPLAESYGVAVPDLIDTNGDTITFGTTLGESICSGLGYGFMDQGYRAFGTKDMVAVFGTGKGGYFYEQLKRGSALWNTLGYQLRTVKAIVEGKGYVFKLAGIFFGQGTADAGGTTTGLPGFETTEFSRRDRLLQFRADFVQLVREEFGDASADPIVWVPSNTGTVPGAWPLLDGQPANIAEGDVLAHKLDNRIRVALQENAYATVDSAHYTKWASYNVGYQAGTVIRQDEGGVGAELPFLPLRVRPVDELHDLVIYDTARGPLRTGGWTTDRLAITAGGSGFTQDQPVQWEGDDDTDTSGLGTANVTAGAITSVTITDPGAFANVQSGARAIKRLITGLETVAAGSGYGAAFNFTIVGGTQIDAGDMLAGTDETGAVDRLIINRLPTWVGDPPTGTLATVGLGSSGITGSGFTVTLTPSTGGGATGTPKHLTQMISCRNFPGFSTALGNIADDGGVAIPAGTELTQSGSAGEIPAEGFRAKIVVTSSTAGGMTGAAFRVGGCYDYDARPTNPVTFTDGTYTVTLTIDAEQWGEWPVSDPNGASSHTFGFDADDGTDDPPLVILAELTGASGPDYRNAILVTYDKPFTTANKILTYGGRNTGTGGPDGGGRGTVHQGVLSPRRGYAGQFAQRRAQRFWQSMPLQPFLDTRPEPLVPNGDFEYWPADTTSVAIPASGQQVGSVFATQGAATDLTIGRATGGGLTVQRNAAAASTTRIVAVPVNLTNGDARRHRGKYLTVKFDLEKGADFSETSGHVTATLYTANTAASLSTTTGLPASATSRGSLIMTPTEDGQAFTFTTGAVLPDTINQIVVRFHYDPAGTAGAADLFVLNKLRLDEGQAAAAFRAESMAIAALRAITPAQIETLGTLAAAGFAEGSWTPTATFSTPGDVNSVTGTGTYTKLGGRCFVDFTLSGTITYTTASGTFRITGLPFAANGTRGGAAIIDIDVPTWNNSATYVVFRTTNAQSYLYIDGNKPAGGGAVAPLTASNVPTGTSFTIIGNFSYKI